MKGTWPGAAIAVLQLLQLAAAITMPTGNNTGISSSSAGSANPQVKRIFSPVKLLIPPSVPQLDRPNELVLPNGPEVFQFNPYDLDHIQSLHLRAQYWIQQRDYHHQRQSSKMRRSRVLSSMMMRRHFVLLPFRTTFYGLTSSNVAITTNGGSYSYILIQRKDLMFFLQLFTTSDDTEDEDGDYHSYSLPTTQAPGTTAFPFCFDRVALGTTIVNGTSAEGIYY
ncbi:MAG: hypothetical protein FRX48_07468 [Lasallia pustulata]|uniref:Uncharacterized protein n=1 Tax=Lasallia pustulata TaxID=136370 RepID=A0A5M8PK10_9LECA|nr:MAG: hypothetical protein FRX48_07468 [Lasallia pustulata]